MIDPLVVERAVLQVLSGHVLSPTDCSELGEDDAAEVARRLIEESKRLRGAKETG